MTLFYRPWPTLFSLSLVVSFALNCRVSEFQCKRSPRCIRLDQVCDGRDNCGDRSDEPEGCTRKYLQNRILLYIEFDFTIKGYMCSSPLLYTMRRQNV